MLILDFINPVFSITKPFKNTCISESVTNISNSLLDTKMNF